MNPLLANLKRHECFNKLFIESVINKQEFKRFKNAHFIEISGDNNPPTGENLLSAYFNATTSDQQLGSAVQMLVNVQAKYRSLVCRRKEMFYLTTHSTHFIYGYMTSDIW